MILEELARHHPPMGGSPDTGLVQEILTKGIINFNFSRQKFALHEHFKDNAISYVRK